MSPRVLIVEDEFLVRLTLSEALSDDGFDVLEAGSGDEALALIGDDSRLDLLLTDMQLPGSTNGRTLAARAREHSPDLPVIFMSGRPSDDSDSDSRACDLFISKPYLPSEICAAVRRLTNRSNAGT
ncbi:MAG: response regulator [Acidisphaera sp.]|nr:response regulator [Acidisphaera sp.]